MALSAEFHSRTLDEILLRILRRSDSAALSAVVASVATAFPHSSGESLLVLLQSPFCIQIDRQRLVHEGRAFSRLSGFLPDLNARNKVYAEERKAADLLRHRSHDLEAAIANLQLGPLAARVHEILDRYRAEMRSVEEQNEEDRIWRLAMHRMDLRQYTIAEDALEASVAAEVPTPSAEGQQYVRLNPNEPEPDVKEMVDKSAAQAQVMNAKLGLLMWGMKAFRGEDSATYDPALWRERLSQSRAARLRSGDDYDPGQGGPGYVAAICIRDHWEEMSEGERDWCVDFSCSEVEREANHWNQTARVQRFDMSADRPCARVLPRLIGKSLPEARQSRVRQVLVVALTHAIDEVRWYSAWGIGESLWTIDRDLTLRCVNTLAMEASLGQLAADAEFNRPYDQRRGIDVIEAEAASIVRQRFFEADGISIDAHQTFDPTRWFGAEANGRILAILGQAPTEPASIAAFQRLGQTLVAWWDEEDDRRHDRNERRRERNHETESALTDLLHNFLLRTSATDAQTILQPILDAIDRHPRNIHWLIQGLIGIEDREANTPSFWLIWNLFADGVRRAGWLAGIDGEHPHGGEMMSAMFLGSYWKAEARHWRSLEGHAHHVHALFENLPASSTVLEDYLRFLFHIGEQSLPRSFIRIAKRLQQGTPAQMLRKGNTVYLLEVLLQRYVYGKPLELKSQSDLRDAILVLLDMLVEQGSSAAFRMRDDFVTPMSASPSVQQ